MQFKINLITLICLLHFQTNVSATFINSTTNKSIDLLKTLSNRSRDQLEGLPQATVILSTIFYSITLIVGLIGNSLVIIVVCYNKSLHHNTNYCLVNLSIADLVLIIVCMPSAILELYSKEVWYFGYFMCKIISWLENSVSNVAILTTVAISIERCCAIMYPFKVKSLFTKKRVFILVILIWITSTLFSLPLLTASRFFKAYHREFRKEVHVCYQVFNDNLLLNYLFISLGLFYLLPCLLLCVLYLKIVCVIKNRTKEHRDSNVKQTLKKSSSKESITKGRHSTCTNIQLPKINEKQIILLLVVMMLLILICLLPIRVFTVWFALSTKEQRKRLGIVNYSIIITFCRVMFYLNSVLNPIFYHFMSTKFMFAFRDFFKSTAKRDSASVLHSQQILSKTNFNKK